MSKIMNSFYLLIALFVVSDLSSAQDFGNTVITNGDYYWDDELANFDNFCNKFSMDDCDMLSTSWPFRGASYFYMGRIDLEILGTKPWHLWGYGFDSLIYALTGNGRNRFMNDDPYKFVQVRLINVTGQMWDENGQNMENLHYHQGELNQLPWPHDPGYFYPNQKMFNLLTHQLEDYAYSRMANDHWNFYVFDHPGIKDYFFWPELDNAEVGLYYANFLVRSGVDETVLQPDMGFHVKILLRKDTTGNCASGYVGRAILGWGWINIPATWAAPPNGINLP